MLVKLTRDKKGKLSRFQSTICIFSLTCETQPITLHSTVKMGVSYLSGRVDIFWMLALTSKGYLGYVDKPLSTLICIYELQWVFKCLSWLNQPWASGGGRGRKGGLSPLSLPAKNNMFLDFYLEKWYLFLVFFGK